MRYFAALSGGGGRPVRPVVVVKDDTIQWDDDLEPYYVGYGRGDAGDVVEGPVYVDAVYRRGAEISRHDAERLDGALVESVT